MGCFCVPRFFNGFKTEATREEIVETGGRTSLLTYRGGHVWRSGPFGGSGTDMVFGKNRF